MNVLALCVFLVACRMTGVDVNFNIGMAWLLAFVADTFIYLAIARRGKAQS